jgi:hypothetical protein
MARSRVWVFGRVEGLLWVLQRNEMAFPVHALQRVSRIESGDRAILYIARGAFSNPTRHESRLVGLVRVTGAPERQTVTVAGRPYSLVVPFRPEVIFGQHSGPSVAALAQRLERVKRPEVWGTYFRNSPIEVSQRDFDVMARAVEDWRRKERAQT